jgi:prophage regulatory protein
MRTDAQNASNDIVGTSDASLGLNRALQATRLLREALALLGAEEGLKAVASRRIPDRLLRMPEVQRLTGLRRSAIYEQMQRGTFPQSVKVGRRATTWSEAAIQGWIAERLKARSRG